MYRPLAWIASVLLLAGCASTGARPPAAIANVPVASVDLQRYAGRWYEQARLPMVFQRHCASDTTADYSPRPDGTIAVRNRCRSADGRWIDAEGIARRVDGSTSRLQVRFAPAWLAWVPVVWGDYWIVALDPGYRWAMVGSPDADYLWILSRAPDLEAGTRHALIERARTMGYPVHRLIDTPHGAVVND